MWPTELLDEQQAKGWLAGAELYRPKPIYLWVPDNGYWEPGTTVKQGYFTVYGLTQRQTFGEYDGVPHLKLRIHFAGWAHGAVQCTDGTLLVTTTEADGETTPPGEVNVNYHESVLVIDAALVRASAEPEVRDITPDMFTRVRCGEFGGPPAFGFPAVTHVGLRDVIQLHDGSILLARGSVFTRLPLAQLRAKTNLASVPVRYTTGANGEITGWFLTPDPDNPEHVWQMGAEVSLVGGGLGPASVTEYDLGAAPNVASVPLRLGRGSNYNPASGPTYDSWDNAGLAFDSAKNMWLARGGVSDLACYTRAQQGQFNGGTPEINLTPAKTITSSRFSALNLANEALQALAIRDDHIFVATYYFGARPAPPARLMIFSPAALAGGAHEPIVEITGLPTRAMQLVFAASI